MTSIMYHVFLSGSQIWWKKPTAAAQTTCAVVLIHDNDLLRVRDALRAVTRRVKHRLRPYLHKKTTVETQPVIAELSSLLGQLISFSFSTPTPANEDEHTTFERLIPEVLQQIDGRLQELGAHGVLYSNYPSLFGCIPTQRIPELCGVGPDREELVLAEFADWASGQHLWQKAVLDHYEEQVSKFEEWIHAYPLLGGYHDLAGPLMEQITNAPSYTIDTEAWFRGRCCKADEVLNASLMGPPPPDLTTEGRYNHAGQPVLYLASDEATCGAEIDDGTQFGRLWVQEFLVARKRVLDLAFHPDLDKGLRHEESELLVAALHGAIGHPSNHGNTWKPEYCVTRFIADIVRCRGYDGIRFNSTRGRGLNLALFSWKTDVSTVGEPHLSLQRDHEHAGGAPSTHLPDTALS